MVANSKEQTSPNTQTESIADRVEITYYTDPLCCWSWAFEPQWRRLRYEFEGKLSWQYVMAGMLPSWNSFHDDMNSVSRPIQMGPVWMHASQLSGMPMNTRIWMEDPPASSYPACIAVKCAALQSTTIAETYLRLVREAIMINGENIAKQDVLIKIAEQTASLHPELNLEVFKQDLINDNGLEAFRKDLQQVQYRNIARYPTLILRYPGINPILITGYRPYPVLVEALKQIAPTLIKTQENYSSDDYKHYWNSLTKSELEEGTRVY